jgi:solute carrier family 25 protein 44
MRRLLALGSGLYTCINAAIYPLSVVKTRMQASGVQLSSRDAIVDLYRVAGVRGLWAGLVPYLAGALPARAGYIVALEGTRPVALSVASTSGLNGPSAAAVSNGAAGFAAVLASAVIFTPCDVVTQRIMVASGASGAAATDQSFWAVVRSVREVGGFPAFYRGFGVTLLTYLPGGSVWWGAYGGARALADERNLGLPEMAERVAAATWASLCTVFVTSPLDVLKTRVQLSTTRTAPPVLEVAGLLLREEGVSGLYRGFLPRWAQAAIFTSAVVTIFEKLKVACRKER